MIQEILEYNRKFVESEKYKTFITGKYPEKKVAVLSCMDTRLTELLPAALGFKNGDIKIIKNAGALVSSPFGSIMRSLIVAVYTLGVEEILVIGHHDCGMQHLNSTEMIQLMKDRGISQENIDCIKFCGIDLEAWMCGFDNAEDSIRSTVNVIKNHLLIPKDIKIHGLIIDPVTGKLDLV